MSAFRASSTRAVALAALVHAACGGPRGGGVEGPSGSLSGGPLATATTATATATTATAKPNAASAATASASEPTARADDEPRAACPTDMALVDTVHCTDPKLTCLEKTLNEPNHLVVCHRFAPERACRGVERRQRFCIDRYEYPNERGAHPPVMVTAYDAAGLCAERGKRLCYESEWTSACEGPENWPFPYGHERSKEKCNIDNAYVHPDLEKAESPKDEVRGPELLRLDQSVLSGTLESCKSGFGVYDLTGNFDEWVLTEHERGLGQWAGLKGGAWGHVRNACRPITTSHVPHWSYYFISFRCCQDADPSALSPLPADDPPLFVPPPALPRPHPSGRALNRGYTPPRDAVRPNAPKR